MSERGEHADHNNLAQRGRARDRVASALEGLLAAAKAREPVHRELTKAHASNPLKPFFNALKVIVHPKGVDMSPSEINIAPTLI
ncbi:hypothetical protein WJX81_004961 [Elliptochloris bilobata]|uniref:Uncharacterized protein n=1 Tax=Elliptochloris bilobata TaxID=381761 RepID=A0AAW1S875_9CHLO